MQATGSSAPSKIMTQEILELIGYISSVLILISLLMTSVVKFRIINAVGSLIFTVYAILIHSYPTAVLNACLVGVDLWFLVKVLRTRLEYTMEAALPGETAVRQFLRGNGTDIARFFPEWETQMEMANQIYVVYYGMTRAGILAGREEANGTLQVLLDYTTPQHRDCSVGRALYPALQRQGYRRLQAKAEVEKHGTYLRKMGFCQQGDVYSLELKP